ncbi:MAG: hypothetical protein QOF79_1448 [Actinomycetota bacterium]|jgi:LysM repeat protein|nr:hypothetical protein [Actinomycetota bacterium]
MSTATFNGRAAFNGRAVINGSAAFNRSSFSGSARPQAAHLKMTARGRAVLISLIATPLVIAALAIGINAGGATATSTSTPLTTVTVTAGQSLWQVARQLAPNADPRDVITDIMSVNQLSSADIVPGEELKIPAKYNR